MAMVVSLHSLIVFIGLSASTRTPNGAPITKPRSSVMVQTFVFGFCDDETALVGLRHEAG
jgi:hypothetical protein